MFAKYHFTNGTIAQLFFHLIKFTPYPELRVFARFNILLQNWFILFQ